MNLRVRWIFVNIILIFLLTSGAIIYFHFKFFYIPEIVVREAGKLDLKQFSSDVYEVCFLPAYEIFGSYKEFSQCGYQTQEVPLGKVAVFVKSKSSCEVFFVKSDDSGLGKDYFCTNISKDNKSYISRSDNKLILMK